MEIIFQDQMAQNLFAGDVISVAGPNFPGTYYVYNQLAHTTSSGVPGSCSLDNPFLIDLVDTSVFTAVSGCGAYTLPAVPFGDILQRLMVAELQLQI